MARRRTYRRSYGRRPYYASRRGGSRRGGMGLNLNPAFLAGAAIGFSDLDKNIPGQVVLGAATAPIRGLGMIKGVAQGIIFGNLVQTIKNTGVSNTGFKGI